MQIVSFPNTMSGACGGVSYGTKESDESDTSLYSVWTVVSTPNGLDRVCPLILTPRFEGVNIQREFYEYHYANKRYFQKKFTPDELFYMHRTKGLIYDYAQWLIACAEFMEIVRDFLVKTPGQSIEELSIQLGYDS